MAHQVVPITPTEPACYGVMCAQHQNCNRWHAAEGRPVVTIGTCENGAGERPMFQARQQPTPNADQSRPA